MQVLMLITADHASVETTTGKLNILGAFKRILATQFPTKLPSMSLVIKLGGEIEDLPNPHTLAVALADEDGKELINISGPFNIPVYQRGVQPEFNAVIEFRDIVFSRPGDYRFYIRVDEGRLDQSTVIQVVQKPEQAQE